MTYKLIALDVDGTLLNDEHQLSEANKEAIAEVTRRGSRIVLCTGRNPKNAIPIMKEMGLTGYVLADNGAVTVAVEDSQVLHQYGMDARGLDPYIAYCRERGIHFDVNTAFDLYVDNVEHLAQEAMYMYEHLELVPATLPSWEEVAEPIVKFTAFAQREVIEQAIKDWGLWDPVFTVTRSGEFFIDIMHPQASKGNALKELAARLDIPREEVLAIGNYFNDISMLTYAGLGIAVDNSPVEVKAAADAVTLSNNENGVRAALLEYALN
ncbi:HAD family hydrolase [Paenibacillus spiritus]|uniref:HAD family hydrolase n=1 Tax=Paenibacillus spiritus TaxID=2496557 RepID=A0A5J5G8C1_9BACL|nr:MULTISPECIES: HAD family hydrolase [Paenibacillus]KAA9003919.1 HAD family hydrolase [Paenibacillus spiritus]